MKAPQASVLGPLVTGLVDLDGHINFSRLDECGGNDRLGVDFFEWHQGYGSSAWEFNPTESWLSERERSG
jgi:hypothetical protein